MLVGTVADVHCTNLDGEELTPLQAQLYRKEIPDGADQGAHPLLSIMVDLFILEPLNDWFALHQSVTEGSGNEWLQVLY